MDSVCMIINGLSQMYQAMGGGGGGGGGEGVLSVGFSIHTYFHF